MNTDNSSMDLDPVLAKQLFAEGAVLIIAGVPKGTKFGIDLCAYTVGDNFRGVKMIPPGPHYVWTAAKGVYGDVAPRVGFVHFFGKSEVIVREWDDKLEELRLRQITDNEAGIERKLIRNNLKALDKFLAPYDYRYVSPWKHLTDTITEAVIERCQPEQCIIRTNIELQSCSDADRPRGPIKTINLQQNINENDLLPNLKPVEGTAPRFSELPTRVPKNATPSEISKHSMDCIEAIDILLQKFNTEQTLIEEIQLAFIFYLVGLSIESLDQWRKLLDLLAHSENAVTKYKLFYMKYSEILAFQLPHLPEELMEPTERNTVYKDIRVLLVNLHLSGLTLSAARLAKKLTKSMQWKFEDLLDDDPEDLPVIVENI